MYASFITLFLHKVQQSNAGSSAGVDRENEPKYDYVPSQLCRIRQVLQGCNHALVHFLFQLLHLNLGALSFGKKVW